jgi:hypothetical protein
MERSEHNPSISLEDYVLSAVEGHKSYGSNLKLCAH